MNFLAHFLLSHHDEELLAGNFIADWVKGKRWEHYPAGIAQGILHHRFIDSFTDAHPDTRTLTKLLRPIQGKYAPVAADLLYDFSLASNFELFHQVDLTFFAAEIYQKLRNQATHFPFQAVRTFEYMQEGDWLSAYASEEGITRAFDGMSQRVRFSNQLQLAPAQLRDNLSKINELFLSFFPEMLNASRTYLGNSRNKDQS